MKHLTSQEFFTLLPQAAPQSAYLVIGIDGFMTEKICQGIRSIVKRQLSPLETLTLYGDELLLSDLYDHLEGYSIFAENRLILIKNAHRLGEENKFRKNPERQKVILGAIAQYLSDPEPGHVLVLLAEAADGRVAEWKKVRDQCQVIVCEAIRWGNEMRHWLERSLRLQNKTMVERAKILFLEKVELDFYTAENELEKLLIFVGERSAITEQDVNVTLPTSRMGPMSDFYRALGNRDADKVTARILDMLENEWADLQILAVLFRFFLALWKIQALRSKHITPAEILKSHLKDLFEKQRKDYLAYASQYSPDEIAGVFRTILETDSAIKLTKADPATLMTVCAVKICRRKS